MSATKLRGITAELPLPKAVKKAAGSHVKPRIRNRRGGVASVLKVVYGENFPLGDGLQHRELAALAQQIDLAIGGDRRRIVRFSRPIQPRLFENLSRFRAQRRQHAAV